MGWCPGGVAASLRPLRGAHPTNERKQGVDPPDKNEGAAASADKTSSVRVHEEVGSPSGLAGTERTLC